jgi:hypothetical protein
MLLTSLTTRDESCTGIPVDGLTAGTAVDIVQARSGFVLERRGERRLEITEERETLPLQFKLRGTIQGSDRGRSVQGIVPGPCKEEGETSDKPNPCRG